MMFIDCFIKECPFCFMGNTMAAEKLCGIGKGNSLVRDIESCNGKRPIYKKGKDYHDYKNDTKNMGREKNVIIQTADAAGIKDIFQEG